jgi:hypothetical protein
VPWFIVDERCSIVPINHKEEAMRRAMPPPPYLPAVAMDEYNEVNGVVMVPASSKIPRIDRLGFNEIKQLSDEEESERLRQLSSKQRVIELALKVEKQRTFMEMELGYNLEKHGLHGRAKKNYLKGSNASSIAEQNNVKKKVRI